MDNEDMTCIIYLILFIIMAIIGGICTNYLLETIFHANISWVGDAIIGTVIAEFVIPVAIVVWVLDISGVI